MYTRVGMVGILHPAICPGMPSWVYHTVHTPAAVFSAAASVGARCEGKRPWALFGRNPWVGEV